MIIRKIVISTLGTTLLLFGFYIYKLHSLAVGGNKIFEQRCITVNPPLIAYKNSFLDFANETKKGKESNPEVLVGYFQLYVDGLKDYVPKETVWLDTQNKFMNRWDFNLIEPWYIKEAAVYQYGMYEGYRDEARALLDIMDETKNREETMAKFNSARASKEEYSQKYFELFDRASGFGDWRKIFADVPLPEACTEDVLRIPDTTGALNPDPLQLPVKNPEITG